MSSHRDIVRSLKQKKASASNDNENKKAGGDEENSNSSETAAEIEQNAAAPKVVKLTAEKKKFDMLASDFLKKRIDEIKSTSKNVQPKSPSLMTAKKPAPPVESIEFELEIVIGETTTNRKLMDKTSGDEELPSLSLSVGTKRKRNEPASDDDDELSLDDELSKKSKTS